MAYTDGGSKTVYPIGQATTGLIGPTFGYRLITVSSPFGVRSQVGQDIRSIPVPRRVYRMRAGGGRALSRGIQMRGLQYPFWLKDIHNLFLKIIQYVFFCSETSESYEDCSRKIRFYYFFLSVYL